MPSLGKSLLGGSIILLITINLFNFLNLVFNISMARLLTLAEYGVLTTLIYIVIIFAIFSESIQTIVSKYTTNEKSPSKIKGILTKSFKKAFLFSIIAYVVFILLALVFSPILNISLSLLSLTGLMIFSSLFVPITRGVMQGKKRFSSLGWNMVSEGIVKLGIAVLLVLVGFGVQGAVLGIILGSLAAILLSFISLKDIFKLPSKKSKTLDIYNYAKPVFIVMFSIVLFLSLDIILARIFFSPDAVGIYAISSTIAKIIFIGTQPISKAMFPFTSESKSKKKVKSFKSSMKLILSLIALSLIVLYFFPDLIIRIYSGRYLPEASSILFPVAISMSILSLTNLFLFYKLSSNKLKSLKLLPIFIVLQIIILTIFNQSLTSFATGMVISSLLFLLGSILLTRK